MRDPRGIIRALAVLQFVVAAAVPSGTAAPVTHRDDPVLAQLDSRDWPAVRRAQEQCHARGRAALPALLRLLARRKVMPLRNLGGFTYAGRTRDLDNGYHLAYDLDWLPCRAGWVLETLTFENFGFNEKDLRRCGRDDLVTPTHLNPLFDVLPRTLPAATRTRLLGDAEARARQWQRETPRPWSRYRALVTALRDGDIRQQETALRWLAEDGRHMPGFTLAHYRADLLPLVRPLAHNDDDDVEETAQRLLAHGPRIR